MTTTTTTTAPTLAYVLLHVADFAAASTYYTDTLGFTPLAEFDGPNFRQFQPSEGGIPFAIAQATAETEPAGAVKLYFATRDIEAVHAAYGGKDVAVGAITPMPFGTVFTFPASDGEAHWVWQPQG